jgi:hypothetical protein
MLRTRLNNSYIKRTIRPLYGWTQATPQSVFLDPSWDRSTPIYPGMVMTKTVGDMVTLAGAGSSAGGVGTAANNVPFGLCANYIGGDGIDELLDVGMNVMACWVLTPDAQFEILAPAFDTTVSWSSLDAGDGTEVLLYASNASTKYGKLTNVSAGGGAVARLVKVNSATKLTIAGVR